MALVIEMKPSEAVHITTKSGDTIRIELPIGTHKRCKVVFFAEDKIQILRKRKEVKEEVRDGNN